MSGEKPLCIIVLSGVVSVMVFTGRMKFNILFSLLVTLVIDFLIIKSIGFAFLPMLAMSAVFFAMSFLLGLTFILIAKEREKKAG